MVAAAEARNGTRHEDMTTNKEAEIAELKALAERCGVTFFDLMTGIRGLREATGTSFEAVVQWVRAQPEQFRSMSDEANKERR